MVMPVLKSLTVFLCGHTAATTGARRLNEEVSIRLINRRWCNQLSPDVRKEPFTEDEDMTILDCHARLGNKWAEIAKVSVTSNSAEFFGVI